jgi:hypothetical protein
LIWNKTDRDYTAKYVKDSMVTPALDRYPNLVTSNYNEFISGGGITEAPADYNGHMMYFKSISGNISSPELYGLVGILGQSGGSVVRVDPADPTIVKIWTSQTGATGVTLERGPWLSLTQVIQQVRSAKRGMPNSYMIPWISDVKFYGESRTEYGASGNGLGPAIGWADVSAGYDVQAGLTFGKAGNSAYYYEMLRHVSMYGVKHFAYFNSWQFKNYGLNVTTTDAYLAAGLTSYQQDMLLLNNTLKEINEQLGGYTIETADTSKISWLANYISSGAPKPDGSYLWRVTVKPGLTLLANGITLSTNIGTVGTWINTSGPTLAGIGLTFI